MEKKILLANNLRKSFNGNHAVNGINFEAKKGQFISILGPNGAGKSTLMGMFTGLISPDSGEISLDGLPTSSNKYREKIGIVFQNHVLDHNLTVRNNLYIRAKMEGAKNYDHTNKLIELFELNKLLKQKYGSLSGGQKRRVDIVRSLLSKPEILFLDEPTTGLDIQTRTFVWQILNKLRVQNKLTVILTTHYLEEAEQSDYLYIVDQGRVIAKNTLMNLKQQYTKNILTLYPKDPSVKRLLHLTEKDDHTLTITTNSFEEALQIIDKVKNKITNFSYKQSTLDDVFVKLTGGEIY